MSQKNTNNQGILFRDREKVVVNYDEVPLSEYPRPQLKRDSYLCLNGTWELAITKSEEIPEKFPLSVRVPFAVESPLSGVNHLLEKNEYLFYRKKVVLPRGFRRDKVILHFDGVDQIADVFINGNLLMSHVGAYLGFSLELPFGVTDRFEILVRVKDDSDSSYHSRGKQVMKPSAYNYTSSSGIYKPVWLESVPRNYVQDISFTPLFDEKSVKIHISTKIKTFCKVKLGRLVYHVESNSDSVLPLIDFHPWSPKDPYLYPVQIDTESDTVTSYFGMRKIEIKEQDGFRHIYLNDEPVFLSGLLDQGYYYLGNLTPSSYQDYEEELKFTKEYGFNCLRVHIKTELDQFYYMADKAGVLLIQDFPSGGAPYSFLATVLPRLFRFLNQESHINEKKLGRGDERGKAEFLEEAKGYIQHFHNHPSIIIYTVFNEGWGEFEPSKVYHMLKPLDDTRLFDTASGWYDAESDFFSVHTYTNPMIKRKNKGNRAYIISEMGGVAYKDPEHSYFEGFFGHGKCKSKEALEQSVIRLYAKSILPQIKERGLNASIYTEIADVETEYNGILTYDRKARKINPAVFQKINQDLYAEFDSFVRKTK